MAETRRWVVQTKDGQVLLVEDRKEIDRMIFERRVDRDAVMFEIDADARRLGDLPDFARFFDLAAGGAPPAAAPRSPRLSTPIGALDDDKTPVPDATKAPDTIREAKAPPGPLLSDTIRNFKPPTPEPASGQVKKPAGGPAKRPAEPLTAARKPTIPGHTVLGYRAPAAGTTPARPGGSGPRAGEVPAPLAAAPAPLAAAVPAPQPVPVDAGEADRAPTDSMARVRSTQDEKIIEADPLVELAGGLADMQRVGARRRLVWALGGAGLVVGLAGAALFAFQMVTEPLPSRAAQPPPPAVARTEPTLPAAEPAPTPAPAAEPAPSAEPAPAVPAPQGGTTAPPPAPGAAAASASPPGAGAAEPAAAGGPAAPLPADPGAAPAVQPKDYGRLVAEADKLLESGKTKRASELYDAALVARPDGAEALAGLGYCAMDRGQFGRAMSQFKKALKRNPGHAAALFGLGEAAREQGSNDIALESFKQYVARFPGGPEAGAARKQIAEIEK